MADLARLFGGVACVLEVVACGFPRPADVEPDGGSIIGVPSDARPVYLEPRYLPDVCDSVATMAAFRVPASPFDTGLDTNCTGGVVSQVNGPQICVVRYGAIEIGASATLTVVGSRALALVADSAVVIEGLLDVSANGTTSGPGGGTVISGERSIGSTGGGGAGFKTAGGAGGNGTTDGGGGLGGRAATDPSLMAVLLGGTRPDSVTGIGALSGGGGGAAMLVACRGEVLVSGTIDAGGGGGAGGGTDSNFQFYAGAGGGSGGYVVLQGLAITVSGQVFANGGGGGAGEAQQFVPGQAGSDGALSATDAAAGGIAVGGAGSGGAGGRQGAAPGVGLHPTVAGVRAGGGGGSIGFFQTYTPMGVMPALTPAAASPLFSPNRVIKTR